MDSKQTMRDVEEYEDADLIFAMFGYIFKRSVAELMRQVTVAVSLYEADLTTPDENH